MDKQRGFTGYEMFVVILCLACIGGWLANIVKFVGMLDGGISAMFIARIVGMVLAPLGVVLGYF